MMNMLGSVCGQEVVTQSRCPACGQMIGDVRSEKLEAVADAVRPLVKYWEDLGDEIQALALAVERLDEPTPVPDEEE